MVEGGTGNGGCVVWGENAKSVEAGEWVERIERGTGGGDGGRFGGVFDWERDDGVDHFAVHDQCAHGAAADVWEGFKVRGDAAGADDGQDRADHAGGGRLRDGFVGDLREA